MFDAVALHLETLYRGVGSDVQTLEIDVRDLVAVADGLVAPVSQPAA